MIESLARSLRRHLPVGAKRLLNRWLRRYGDPGDLGKDDGG